MSFCSLNLNEWKQCFNWSAYVVSAILLCIIINSQPILEDDKLLINLKAPFNNSFFTNTYLTQRLPASKYTIRAEGSPTEYNLGIDVGKTIVDLSKSVNKVVKEFINDQFDQVIPTDQYISPITSTMLLMGCYGDRWSSNFTKLMDFTWMKPTQGDNPLEKKYNFLFHLMLHALDNAVEQESGIHDRTTCSCLRDFATPFYLKTREKYDSVLFASCKETKGQTHDSCSLRSLIQYSNDSSTYETGVRNSTLHDLIQKYMNSDAPLDEVPVTINGTQIITFRAVKQLKQVQHILEFTKEYCKHDPKCPEEFKNETTPLRTVLLKMQEMVPHMHAYNKLTVPQFKFPITAVGTDQQIYDEKAYMQKYAVAFRTCLAVGVPHMTNNIVGVTNQVYWIVIGESILVFASAVSYAYAIALSLWNDAQFAHSSDSHATETLYKETLYKTAVVIIIVFAFVQFLVASILLFVNQGVPIYKFFETLKYNSEETDSINNFQPEGLNVFFGLFIFLWCFLALLSMLLLFYTMYKKFFKKNPSQHAEGEKVNSQVNYEMVQEGEGDCVNIISDLFAAQIVIDVPIIIGLSITAVGIILQSGAAEYCVIITVLILFTSTGIVTHITNVMRMLHLEAQMVSQMLETTEGNEQHEQHKKYMSHLVYNRVLIAVVIGGLIFVCLNLAGLDPAQAHDLVRLASQQQIILGVITFWW
jgi:hypothetical protein